MVQRIEGMPAGTIGLRTSGKLTKDDYRDVLEPAIKEAVDSGEARVLCVLESYDGLEPGAWIEDLKTGLGMGHRSAWKRMSLLTDVEWIQRATKLFAWMIPGEVLVGGLDQEDHAKRWIAE